MHEKNIIHLDIKPENIMCQKRNSNLVKIIDFGLATKLDPHEIVKISTGTAEFAAPEIVEREAVGFYTDMWACGVLTYVLLSGLTPFAGENDIETLKNVKACNWEFDPDAFANISDEAKDFIKNLLTKAKEKRMTAHECLAHPWLKRAGDDSDQSIPGRKYWDIRDRIRAKYPSWDRAAVPIGHIANYSSLRKLQDEKYKLHDFFLDRREALPRFVLKPQSTIAYEGQSAKFFCRVIAAAPPTLSWYREGMELKQSVKFMKRYSDNDYTFMINRCRLEDRGEYIIKAENHYGSREEPVFLNVLPLPKDDYRPAPEEPTRRRREPLPHIQLDEPNDRAPFFTFLLRTRIIQTGIGVKLLCCLEGKPWPTIQWLKDGRVLNKSEYTMSAKDGIVTLDILACRLEDAGKYTCIASNHLGTSETSCSVIVEPKRMVSPSPVRSGSPISGRISYVSTVKSPLDAYYTSGGASTVIREARASSVYNTRTTNTISSVRKESITSLYDRSSVASTTNHRYQHQSSYTSSSNVRDRYSSTRTTSYDGLRASSVTGFRRAESPRISSPSMLSTRPSALPTHSYRTSTPTSTGGRAPSSYHHHTPSSSSYTTSSDYGRTRKATGKLDGIFIFYYYFQKKSLIIFFCLDSFSEPSFITKLSDRKVKDGEQLFLSVMVKGDPEPKIEWFKDGRKVVSSDVVDLKYRTGTATLTIEEAFPEDEGSYECVAINSEGKSTTKCFITIIRKLTSCTKIFLINSFYFS